MRAFWLALLAFLLLKLDRQSLLAPQLPFGYLLGVSIAPLLFAFGAALIMPATFTNRHTLVWCVAPSRAFALPFVRLREVLTLRSDRRLGSRSAQSLRRERSSDL